MLLNRAGADDRGEAVKVRALVLVRVSRRLVQLLSDI